MVTLRNKSTAAGSSTPATGRGQGGRGRPSMIRQTEQQRETATTARSTENNQRESGPPSATRCPECGYRPATCTMCGYRYPMPAQAQQVHADQGAPANQGHGRPTNKSTAAAAAPTTSKTKRSVRIAEVVVTSDNEDSGIEQGVSVPDSDEDSETAQGSGTEASTNNVPVRSAINRGHGRSGANRMGTTSSNVRRRRSRSAIRASRKATGTAAARGRRR